MSSFFSRTLQGTAREIPHWMQAISARGRERWQGTQLPTRGTESWKYTSLSALRDDYQLCRDAAEPVVLPPRLAAGFGGARLVFVDGVLRPELSRVELPDGVRLCRFSDADETQARRIGEHLDSVAGAPEVADKHPFAVHNTAALADGVFLDIEANADIESPLECLWLASGRARPTAVNQRLLVLAGSHSQATVLEHFAALEGAGSTFTNGVSELILSPGARLRHYRIHEESGEALHVGAVHVRLERDAQLEGFHLATGSRLKRLDVVVHHAGAGAHADLKGVYLPRGEEHIDYHTTIEHAVGHCSTDEVFRGIISDRSTAVFNGRIHIHPQAQKTRAELSNKNLLTSAEAQVNSKPELEIYADDVQCAHGATVAQLDALALHYLRTRGVSRAEAELMLSFAFINELVEAVTLDSLRGYLRPLLAERFRATSTAGVIS